jgi:hypothetical protein
LRKRIKKLCGIYKQAALATRTLPPLGGERLPLPQAGEGFFAGGQTQRWLVQMRNQQGKSFLFLFFKKEILPFAS